MGQQSVQNFFRGKNMSVCIRTNQITIETKTNMHFNQNIKTKTKRTSAAKNVFAVLIDP